MNDQPTLFDTSNTLVDSLFRRARVLETEGQIEKPLSPRQIEIMTLIAEGQTVKGAAYILGISAKVARNYKREAVARLDGRSITNAVAKAIVLGIITIEMSEIEKVHH